MPIVRINGIDLSFDAYGSGEPVLLVTGTGAHGRAWKPHQVSALTAAGYRPITPDNHGIAPTGTGPEGFTLDDMVADTAGLIEHLGIGPCRVVGYSLGGMIVQELLVARPGLVRQAVLIATRGRTDTLARAMSEAEIELCDSGMKLPSRYAAVVRAMQSLSPRTLGDEEQLRDWLDVLELSAIDLSSVQGQLGLEQIPDRLDAYRGIRCPCLVIGFQHDLIVRPALCRELAEHIPGSTYQEIADCGHYGYLEQPEAVNAAIIGFLREAGGGS